MNNLDNKTFFLIAGPCVIESEEHCIKMAGEIKKICDKKLQDIEMQIKKIKIENNKISKENL